MRSKPRKPYSYGIRTENKPLLSFSDRNELTSPLKRGNTSII